MAVSQPEGGPHLLRYLRVSKAGAEILGAGWSSLLSLEASQLPFHWKMHVGEGESQLGVPSAAHDGLRHRQASEGVFAFFPFILAWRILMDRGAWWVTVHGITKSWTRLSD